MERQSTKKTEQYIDEHTHTHTQKNENIITLGQSAYYPLHIHGGFRIGPIQ